MNIRAKATDAIKRMEKTNSVIISDLRTSFSAEDGMGDVHVTAFVGTEVSRPKYYTLRWDKERQEFVDVPDLISQFKREYRDFKLSGMTKQELFALLVKANRRRKSEVEKWRTMALRYRQMVEPVTLEIVPEVENIISRKNNS